MTEFNRQGLRRMEKVRVRIMERVCAEESDISELLWKRVCE